MNLPRKITVLTQSVPITRVKDLVLEGTKCYGVFSADEPAIQIMTGLGQEHLRSTLVHESLHAILTIGGLSNMFEGDAEEAFVARFGPMLLSWLRENRGAVAYLQERMP